MTSLNCIRYSGQVCSARNEKKESDKMNTMMAIVVASTLAITLFSAWLAVLLYLNYREKKNLSYVFWSAGLAFFAIGTLLEAIFAYGIYSQTLAKLYLFVVALLVVLIGEGSALSVKNKIITYAFTTFTIVASLFMLYALAVSTIGNIIVNYVVYGALPIYVVIASSVATFPAVVMIIAAAIISYRHTRNAKMLSIIAGVIIVSIAGTLYIVQFPVLLYYAEAAGIALLWLGFYSRKHI